MTQAASAPQVAVIPKVVVKKTVRAARERVFEAWTKPELMQQWFHPPGWRAVTQNECRVGGSYSHDMIGAGDGTCDGVAESREDGDHWLHTGEYLEIIPPEKLVFTWNSPAVRDTRVTVELRDLGTETEIVITHELLATEQLRSSHTEGWNECLGELAETFKG